MEKLNISKEVIKIVLKILKIEINKLETKIGLYGLSNFDNPDEVYRIRKSINKEATLLMEKKELYDKYYDLYNETKDQ